LHFHLPFCCVARLHRPPLLHHHYHHHHTRTQTHHTHSRTRTHAHAHTHTHTRTHTHTHTHTHAHTHTHTHTQVPLCLAHGRIGRTRSPGRPVCQGRRRPNRRAVRVRPTKPRSRRIAHPGTPHSRPPRIDDIIVVVATIERRERMGCSSASPGTCTSPPTATCCLQHDVFWSAATAAAAAPEPSTDAVRKKPTCFWFWLRVLHKIDFLSVFFASDFLIICGFVSLSLMKVEHISHTHTTHSPSTPQANNYTHFLTLSFFFSLRCCFLPALN
jgi:hypothetical protein